MRIGSICGIALLNSGIVAASVHDDLLAKPYFDLQFSHESINSREVAKLRETQQTAFKYRVMNDGENKFLCAVPNITRSREPPTSEERLHLVREEKEESIRAGQRGEELLSGLEGTCLYWLSGWWTYKFCYSEGITQFHALQSVPGAAIWPPKEDPGAGVYSLSKRRTGSQKSDAQKAIFKSQGTSKSLSLEFEKGTYCPVIGAERKTEVQFQCSSATNDQIAYVKEISSCRYLMVIRTARLCHDVAFREARTEPSNEIKCSLISDEPSRPALDASDTTFSGTTPEVFAESRPSPAPEAEETSDGDGEEQPLSHLAFGEIPQGLAKFLKGESRDISPVGGQRPPDVPSDSSSQATTEDMDKERLTTAIELAHDIADQLEDGSMTVNGESIFDAKNENIEFDVELQDEHGAALGSVVMKVVDGEVVIELEDELARAHEQHESKLVENQNKEARQKIPEHVQATFDRFIGRDEL